MPSYSLLSLAVRSAYNVHKGFVVAKLQEERRISLSKVQNCDKHKSYTFFSKMKQANEQTPKKYSYRAVVYCARFQLRPLSCLYVWNNTTPTRRVFLKSRIWDIEQSLSKLSHLA